MITNQDKPEELIRAEKLIDDGIFDKALEIMKEFERKAKQSSQSIVLSHLLECNLLFQQSLYEKVTELS
jgi:hypothetical protein